MRYELREESTGGANSLANASSHHISGPNTIAYKQHQNCSSTRTTRPLELISDDPDDDVANRENYSPVRKVRRMGGGFNNNSNNNEATTNISISNNNNDNAAAAAAAAATPEVYKFLTFRHLLAKFEREDLPATLNANSNNNNSATSIPNGNNSDANAAIVHQQLEHTFIQLSTLQSKIRNYLLASSGSSPSKTSSTATSATSSTSTTTTITNSPSSSSSSHQQQQTTTSKWQYSHGQELLHHAGGMLYSSSSSTSEEEDVVTAFADVRVVMPTPVIIPDIDYAIPSTSGNNINKNDYTPISVCSSNSPNSPPSDHTSTPSYSNANANNNNNNDPSTPLSQLRRGSNNNNIASASSSPATPICKRLESLYDDTHQHNGIAALCDQTPFAARLGAFGKIYPSVPPASSSSSEGQDHGEAPDEVVLFDGVALLQPDGEDLYTSPVSSSSSSMHRRMISSVETTPIKMSPSPDNNKQKRNIRRVTRVPAANRAATTTTTTATASGNGNGDNNDNQGDDVMMGAAEYKKKRRLSFGSLADQYNAHVRGYTIGATTTTTTTTTTSATIFSNNNNSSSSNNFTLPQQQQQQSEGSSSWKKLRLETPEQTAPASAFIFGNDFNQLQQQEHNNNNDDDLTMPTTTEAARKRSRFESVQQQQQQQHQHQQQQHFEGPYRSQLLALHEMGLLKDLEVCTTLLLRHNGDISRVVQALLES